MSLALAASDKGIVTSRRALRLGCFHLSPRTDAGGSQSQAWTQKSAAFILTKAAGSGGGGSTTLLRIRLRVAWLALR